VLEELEFVGKFGESVTGVLDNEDGKAGFVEPLSDFFGVYGGAFVFIGLKKIDFVLDGYGGG
jgi:hypothetical protein